MQFIIPPNASLLMQIVLWFEMLTLAASLVAIAFFMMHASRLKLEFFYWRGRVLWVAGVGTLAFGAYLAARHHVANIRPSLDPIPIGLMIAGITMWLLGEHLERRAKRQVRFFKRVLDRVENSEQDGSNGQGPTAS